MNCSAMFLDKLNIFLSTQNFKAITSEAFGEIR